MDSPYRKTPSDQVSSRLNEHVPSYNEKGSILGGILPSVPPPAIFRGALRKKVFLQVDPQSKICMAGLHEKNPFTLDIVFEVPKYTG